MHDVSADDLENILYFMYEGQVNVSQSKLVRFFKLAESLQMKGVPDTASFLQSPISKVAIKYET